MRIYLRANTAVIELPELKDDVGSLVTTATVEATITLESGEAVPGVTNPILMTHQGSGRYVGQAPPIELDEDEKIIVKVRSEISGVVGTSKETMVLKDRGFSGGCWTPT